MKRSPLDIFLPNRFVPSQTMLVVIAAQIAIALVIWFASPFKVLPKPGDVFSAFGQLTRDPEFTRSVTGSFTLFFKALGLIVAISLTLSYLTVVPFFRPLVSALTKGRFLSLVGFSVVFTLLLDGDGAKVKLAMLVLGGVTFLLTSTADVVAQIPRAQFDHARTLRMSEWQVVWEVVVRGTLSQMLDAIRQNAAVLWALLPVVETMFRNEHGLGQLLDVERKYFHLDKVYAIQLVFVAIGLFQDWAIGMIRTLLCPHADLTKERQNG
jgi:NitT/TauT family transport system permease protein